MLVLTWFKFGSKLVQSEFPLGSNRFKLRLIIIVGSGVARSVGVGSELVQVRLVA